jgi:1-acyl-sn-glycerol-3-phosphate acyltransferase
MVKWASRRKSAFYEFARFTVAVAIRGLYRVRTHNVVNVPREGPAIIASNHIHNFDPLVIGITTPRFIEFMAKMELFRFPLFAQILNQVGAFPVRRGTSDKAAIRRAIDIPRQGSCLVIFPEGHRSKDGSVGEGMSGVAFIARKSGCPVVPTAIIGPYKFRGPLSVRYGEPITATPHDTNESFLEKIMERIKDLHSEGHVM